MCLILDKNSVRTVAYTDIVVYKMVTKVTRTIKQSFFGFIQSETFYRSPFYRFDYEKDVVYCGKLRKLVSPYSGDLTVEDGFHSYARLEDAKRNTGPYGIVVKCIIPTGAEFFKGTGIDQTPQYASNKIMIKEEVKHSICCQK